MLLVINETTSTIEASIPVRSGPIALAISPSGNRLYVGHAGNRSVLVIELDSLSVQRVIGIPFLVFGLVAPTDDTLVGTTHDDQWSGGYPYVLNATSGAQLQRLSDDQGNMVYQDAMPVLSPDRQRLFLVNTLLAPVQILSFARNAGESTWSYAGRSAASAQLGAYATDAAVSADGAYLYVATATTPALQVATGNLAVVGRLGTSNESRSVTVSPFGGTVGVSSLATGVILYSSSGRSLATKSFEAPPNRLRSTSDGLKLVASVGTVRQDIEVVWSTALGRTNPGRYTNDSTPVVSVQVALFAEPPLFQFNLTLNGTRLVASYNPTEGELVAQVPFSLDPGVRYGVRAEVAWPGSGIALGWTITLHCSPPVLDIVGLPPSVPDPVVTVRGTVSDDVPLSLWIDGAEVPYWAIDSDGHFSQEVNLTQGSNTITVVAKDAAGNQVVHSLAIAFVPRLEYFTNLEKHFRIAIPYGWEVVGPVRSNGKPVDLYMSGRDVDANMIVYSESRELTGTYGEALTLLQEDLTDLASEADFQALAGPATRIIGGHAAASAIVRWHANTSDLVAQVITVVLGPEHAMFWAIIGTMYASELNGTAPILNQTTETFEILPPNPTQPVNRPPVLLVYAAVGVVASLFVLGWLVIAAARRARHAERKDRVDRKGRRID